jgi:hypothetical protein
MRGGTRSPSWEVAIVVALDDWDGPSTRGCTRAPVRKKERRRSHEIILYVRLTVKILVAKTRIQKLTPQRKNVAERRIIDDVKLGERNGAELEE